MLYLQQVLARWVVMMEFWCHLWRAQFTYRHQWRQPSPLMNHSTWFCCQPHRFSVNWCAHVTSLPFTVICRTLYASPLFICVTQHDKQSTAHDSFTKPNASCLHPSVCTTHDTKHSRQRRVTQRLGWWQYLSLQFSSGRARICMYNASLCVIHWIH